MEAYSYVGDELEIFQHAKRWKAYYARALRPYIIGDVLEVGAGLGATSRFLCDGSQHSWTCMEPDPELFSQLEAGLRTEPLASRVRAVLGTVSSFPVGEQFDSILYIDVLEHIEDDRRELAESAAHLRPGGHLVVLAPAHQALFSPFDQAVGHFRRYSRVSLVEVASPSLRLVTAYYLDSIGMIASMANRLLLRASMPTREQIMFWDRLLVPVSRMVDPLFGFGVGKSVVAIWTRV